MPKAQYREGGFEGLKPKPKGRKPLLDTIPAEVLEEAILLRREVPKRSVRQIIQILEWDQKIAHVFSACQESTTINHLMWCRYVD